MSDHLDISRIKSFQYELTRNLLSAEDKNDEQFFLDNILKNFMHEKYTLADSEKVRALQHKTYWITIQTKQVLMDYCGTPKEYFEPNPPFFEKEKAAGDSGENMTYIESVTVYMVFFPREIYWLQNYKTLLNHDTWVEFDYLDLDDTRDPRLKNYTYYFNHNYRFLLRKKQQYISDKVFKGQGQEYTVEAYQSELYNGDNMFEVFQPSDSSIFENSESYKQKNIFEVMEVIDKPFKLYFKRECVVTQSLNISSTTTFADIKRTACLNWRLVESEYILSLNCKQSYLDRDVYRPVVNDDLADPLFCKQLGTNSVYSHFNNTNRAATLYLNFNELSGQRVCSMYIMNDLFYSHKLFSAEKNILNIRNPKHFKKWFDEFDHRFNYLQFDEYYNNEVSIESKKSVNELSTQFNIDNYTLFDNFKSLQYFVDDNTNELEELSALYNGNLHWTSLVIVLVFIATILILSNSSYLYLSVIYNNMIRDVYTDFLRTYTRDAALSIEFLIHNTLNLIQSTYFIDILSSRNTKVIGTSTIHLNINSNINYESANFINNMLYNIYKEVDGEKGESKEWTSIYKDSQTWEDYLYTTQSNFIADNYTTGYYVNNNQKYLKQDNVEDFYFKLYKVTSFNIGSIFGYENYGYMTAIPWTNHTLEIEYNISNAIIINYDYITEEYDQNTDTYSYSALTNNNAVSSSDADPNDIFLNGNTICYYDYQTRQSNFLYTFEGQNSIYLTYSAFENVLYNRQQIRLNTPVTTQINMCYIASIVRTAPKFSYPYNNVTNEVTNPSQSVTLVDGLYKDYTYYSNVYKNAFKDVYTDIRSDFYYLKYMVDNNSCDKVWNVCILRELREFYISMPIYDISLAAFYDIQTHIYYDSGNYNVEFVPLTSMVNNNVTNAIKVIVICLSQVLIFFIWKTDHNENLRLKLYYIYENLPIDLYFKLVQFWNYYNIYWLIVSGIMVWYIIDEFIYLFNVNCFTYLAFNQAFFTENDVCFESFRFDFSNMDKIFVIKRDTVLFIVIILVIIRLLDFFYLFDTTRILLETIEIFFKVYAFSMIFTMTVIIIGFVGITNLTMGETSALFSDPIKLLFYRFIEAFSNPNSIKNSQTVTHILILILYYFFMTIYISIFIKTIILYCYTFKIKKKRFLEGNSKYMLRKDDFLKIMMVDVKSEHVFDKYKKFHDRLDILAEEQKVKFKMGQGVVFKNDYDIRSDVIESMKMEHKNLKSKLMLSEQDDNVVSDQDDMYKYQLLQEFTNYMDLEDDNAADLEKKKDIEYIINDDEEFG